MSEESPTAAKRPRGFSDSNERGNKVVKLETKLASLQALVLNKAMKDVDSKFSCSFVDPLVNCEIVALERRLEDKKCGEIVIPPTTSFEDFQSKLKEKELVIASLKRDCEVKDSLIGLLTEEMLKLKAFTLELQSENDRLSAQTFLAQDALVFEQTQVKDS